jgi:hypothetical protein
VAPHLVASLVVTIQVTLGFFVSNFNIKKYLFHLVPGVGNVAPATVGAMGAGTMGADILGANLPHVDPNNFPGTVHWGPESAMSGAQIGQLPPGAGLAGSGAGVN